MCAFEPNKPLHLAHGPDSTIEVTSYHKDLCSLEPDGHLPPDFMSLERSRAEALTNEQMDATRELLKVFSVGTERLLRLLQTFSGVTRRLKSDPKLSVPRVSFVPRPCNFNLLAIRALHEPWLQARIAREELKGSVEELGQKIQFVSVLQQLVCQKLQGKCGATVLSFFGSASYLPIPGKMLTFSFEEVEAPQPDSVSANGLLDPEGHEVIQYIEHHEPPAERVPELAAMQVEQDWADHVEALIRTHRPEAQQENQENTAHTEDSVYLLEYQRHSDKFQRALVSGMYLESCRSALMKAGFQWLHESGAKIFVHPWQFEATMATIAQQGLPLRPYDVIVSESLEYLVQASLSDIPCRDGARVKTRQVLEPAVYTDESQPDTEDENLVMTLVIARTFLCAVPRLRACDSVTQSTTEAHRGGLNPRRVTI